MQPLIIYFWGFYYWVLCEVDPQNTTIQFVWKSSIKSMQVLLIKNQMLTSFDLFPEINASYKHRIPFFYNITRGDKDMGRLTYFSTTVHMACLHRRNIQHQAPYKVKLRYLVWVTRSVMYHKGGMSIFFLSIPPSKIYSPTFFAGQKQSDFDGVHQKSFL